jgi:hypothetical protein
MTFFFLKEDVAVMNDSNLRINELGDVTFKKRKPYRKFNRYLT